MYDRVVQATEFDGKPGPIPPDGTLVCSCGPGSGRVGNQNYKIFRHIIGHSCDSAGPGHDALGYASIAINGRNSPEQP